MASFPQRRLRRLRRTPALRRLVRENRLSADDLILPIFVRPGQDAQQAVASMPGVAQMSADVAARFCRQAQEEGLSAVLLFGIPESKDAEGSSSWSEHGVVQQALQQIGKAAPGLVRIVDLCMCEYTDHGHCGALRPERSASNPATQDASAIQYEVDNDATLDLLARQALSLAEAGADVIAPSDMMDGRIAHLRAALDGQGYTELPLLSYAAKFASAYYGPFREAAESAPSFGDRRAYQMDPANGREALREAAMDEEEGADLLMVKPAQPYLDVLCALRAHTDLPLVAYQVSGEYAMLRAAADRGWLDYERVLMESLLGIRRAGADLIITYGARDAARLLREGWTE